MRAVRARAASPGAAGTATEAPASVFLGRARALRPRSSPPRRGSQPHRQDKTSNHTPAHATRRSARSVPRDRPRSLRAFARAASRSPQLPRRARIGRVARARDAAQRRARRTFGARFASRKPRRGASQSVKTCRKKYLSCSASAVSKKVYLSMCAKFSPMILFCRQKSRNVASRSRERTSTSGRFSFSRCERAGLWTARVVAKSPFTTRPGPRGDTKSHVQYSLNARFTIHTIHGGSFRSLCLVTAPSLRRRPDEVPVGVAAQSPAARPRGFPNPGRFGRSNPGRLERDPNAPSPNPSRFEKRSYVPEADSARRCRASAAFSRASTMCIVAATASMISDVALERRGADASP